MRTTNLNFSTKIITLLTTLTLVLFSDFSKAQSQVCGSDDHLHSQLLQDPGLKSRIDAYLTTQPKVLISPSVNRATASAITIPVVVHVVYNTTAQNVSDAQIQSQIDVLNEDFGRSNADTVNTPSVFQPYAANPNIQFVLAKRDPNGNATTGITRTSTSVTAFTTNNYVKFDAYGGKNGWDASQYLNIWVCNLSGYAGYATTPGQTASIDGVVISYLSFGRIGTLASSSTKGRTTTHEVGHWLGLAHTWGWSGTCGDDGMADTPTQEKQNSGIPTFPHVSACSPNSNGDMFMNYMDYSDDRARNMFTANQAAYMNGTLNGYRASLKTSLGGVAPGTTTTVACSVPSGLSATSITSVSAVLNWSNTGATGYNVRYKTTASSIWNNANTTMTSLSISGLAASTAYEFQIASVCSTTSSAYSSSATFTTATGTSTSSSTTAFSGNTITIGTSATSQASMPYGTSYVKEHTQMIVSKSELIAAGYVETNNLIKSLSFFVNSASPQTLSNFTIKLAHISNAEFSNSNFISTSNAVTVYASSFATTNGNWNKHAFTTSFAYNGVDNLLIDITWNNSTASTNSSVYASGTTSNKTLFYGATSKKTNINNVKSGTLSLSRPNMKFEFTSSSTARLAGSENSEPTISAANKIEMTLYPNPATTNLNVNINGVKEGSNMIISIFDISGSLVGQFEQIADSQEKQVISIDSNIQIQNLSTGIYIVTIETTSTRISQKFVLNK